ncbi:VWA domain-containing protein, partial [bacterium]
MIAAAAALLLVPQKPVENPGQMFIAGRAGRLLMPLERTSVNAEVAGMGARVTVKQSFYNPSKTPIEAIYTFPLPHDAAVDRMKIRIGDRSIDGTIMRRQEAKETYDKAKAAGQTAALLDQETDNIFTQSVANVMPGRRIEVEISYVQLLKFEDGEFEFSYPMVVGPRFMGQGTPNPGKISPPTLPPGVRSGANIELAVTLHGGAPIQEFRSVLHQVRASRPDNETVQIALAKRDEIPNRDFILRYRTAAKDVQESTFATWDDATGGHFALVLAPPPQPDETLRSPKEMIFVVDQSGSQSGFPIDKSKELSLALLGTMGPRDSFNVMGFSNEVNPLWPGPRPNTEENRKEAEAFIKGLEANGGTELEKAVVASLSPSVDPERVRVVLFNTDGFAG